MICIVIITTRRICIVVISNINIIGVIIISISCISTVNSSSGSRSRIILYIALHFSMYSRP